MRRVATLASALVLLPAGHAAAQDIQNFRPAPGSWNYLGVEGAELAGHNRAEPSLMLNFGWQPLVARESDDGEVAEILVRHMTTANVMAAVGMGAHFELGVDLPVHYLEGDGLAARGEEGFALGDLRILPKLRLYERRSHLIGVGIAIAAPVTLATGREEAWVGEGQTEIHPKLLAEASVPPGVRLALNLGVRVRPERREIEQLELGNELSYGAAGSVELGSPDLLLLGELYGAAPLEDIRDQSRAAPLEWLVGTRWFTGLGPVVTVGGGTGIIDDYGSPVVRLLAGLSWDLRESDRDRDGLSDGLDRCPDDPEDADGFEDSDGCPDPDNDGDRVLDDADGCPDEPEDVDGFEDLDGCPDPDNDADGVLDPDDRCPADPETVNGVKDEDGCPDAIGDADGDGLPDDVDRCKDEPEDKDGFEDEDGCPDRDNDRDGIVDLADRCPDDPEVVNNHEDEDGCPDEAPRVRVSGERIEILDKVFFEVAKDIIRPVSYGILNQVARLLKQRPDIKLVQVEGHTDSQGSSAYNLDLSQRRAQAVLDYLVKAGVAKDRMVARGFGEEVPIESNETEEGRARNRRVEFVILEGPKMGSR